MSDPNTPDPADSPSSEGMPPPQPQPQQAPPQYAAPPPQPGYAPPQPGYAPQPQPAYAPPPQLIEGEPVLATIGDILVSQTKVATPTGVHPLRGTQWYVTDQTVTEEAIPQWAIICAVVGFFFVCLFSLLFLLVKEKKTTGIIQVSVQGEGWTHTSPIPVSAFDQAANLNAQAAYARNLAAALG